MSATSRCWRAVSDHLAAREPKQVKPAEETALAEVAASDVVAESPPAWENIGSEPAGSAAREQALAARAAQGKVRHFLARAFDVKTDERAWRIGADGEQAVAAQLAKLGPEWRVLHAIRVGDRGSDIDHLVIGPGGVLTVNAKHHPKASVWVRGDTFMVNGCRVPYIRNSRHEAKRAARLLTEQIGFPVTALGVIAVMGAHQGLKIKKQPEDGAVVIVQRRKISQYVRALPPRLTEREVAAIHEAARRSTTWR